MADSRRTVLWIGAEPPEPLRTALASRDLALEQVTRNDVPNMCAKARALVIQVDRSLVSDRTSIVQMLMTAFNHGLLLILVQAPEVPAEDYYSVAAEWKLREPDRTRVVYDRWEEAAEAAARHPCGPEQDGQLQIAGLSLHGDEPGILFARAFRGLGSILVKEISGGRSGASVWLVHQVEPGGIVRAVPYLAKLHSRTKVREERMSFASRVRDTVPFSHRPNIDDERYVEGNSLALLVQDFVDRAAPLGETLEHANAGQLVASIFDGALRGCQARAIKTSGSLGIAFESLKILKWLPELESVSARAKQQFGEMMDPLALKDCVTHLPLIEYAAGMVHGDLHLDNVFVASGSSHVILIDFGRVATGPLAADYACLDVSIGWTGRSALGEDALRSLYSAPLSPVHAIPEHMASSWVSRALRAVRHGVLLVERNQAVYEFAVAAYLVRLASYDSNGPLERRALGYHLACQLFREVGGRRAQAT